MQDISIPYHARIPRCLYQIVFRGMFALSLFKAQKNQALWEAMFNSTTDEAIVLSTYVIVTALFVLVGLSTLNALLRMLYTLFAWRSIDFHEHHLVIPKVSFFGRDKAIQFQNIAGIQGLERSLSTSFYGIPIPFLLQRDFYIYSLDTVVCVQGRYISKADRKRLTQFLSVVNADNDITASSYNLGGGVTKVLAVIAIIVSVYVFEKFQAMNQLLSLGVLIPLPEMFGTLLLAGGTAGLSFVVLIEVFRVMAFPLAGVLRYDGEELVAPSLFGVLGKVKIPSSDIINVKERGYLFRRLLIHGSKHKAVIYRAAMGRRPYSALKRVLGSKVDAYGRSKLDQRLRSLRKVS